MSNQTDADKALELLVAEGNAAMAGDDQHKSNFDTFLTQMASSDNVDPAMRQAALQMRLPDTKVGRNAEGNLSFTSRSPKDDKLPDAFKSKRLTTLDNNTLVVGDANDVQVFNAKSQSFSNQARRANRLYGTNNKRTANLLNQLDGISGIENLQERERALIDLSGSIELALNDRRLELTEQSGLKFNLPDLERRLREAEAADRADARWSEFQHDSPVTAQLRQETERARQLAMQDADRSYTTDSVALELSTKRKQVTDRLQSDADAFKKGATPDELFNAIYSNEDKLLVTEAYKAANGGKEGSEQDMLAFMQNNKTLQALQQGDTADVVAHAFTPGTTDNALVRHTIYGMESAKVGSALAEQRISELDAAYKRLQEALSVDEEELSKYSDLLQIPGIEQLRKDQQDAANLLTASQQEKAKAALPRKLVGIAQAIVLQNDVDRFMSGTDIDLPTSTDPAIQSLVQQAKDNNHNVDWLIAQAVDNPTTQSAMASYLQAAWSDKMDSVLLGPAIDSQSLIAARVKAKYLGISGDSIVMGPSRAMHYLSLTADPLLTTAEQAFDISTTVATAPYNYIGKPIIDWLAEPVQGDSK